MPSWSSGTDSSATSLTKFTGKHLSRGHFYMNFVGLTYANSYSLRVMTFYYEGNALHISLKIPKCLDKVIYRNTFEWLLLKIPYNPGQNIRNKIKKSSKTT